MAGSRGRRLLPVASVLLVGLTSIAPGSPGAGGENAAATEAGETASVAPGGEPYPAELRQRLRAALAGRGEAYVPRTRHLRDDGSPRFTNRLILESSPYLLQHAHNPVDWYPWGDEAFAAARRLGRPVLLSIGYSTCHWCHVMEEESFEDLEIAAYLNAHYVAIKVDREERPDLDSVYMSAVQLLTGRGGWPMTTWLTPEREPFFGGTYFPARDGDRGSPQGFLTLLRELKAVYDEQPDRVALQARQVTSSIREGMVRAADEQLPGVELIDPSLRALRARFDAIHGGLDPAPRFPSDLPIRLLLRRHRANGDAKLLEMATLTLTRMAEGGIYDQIGGGFHRYSTDDRWLVPHFEKMLYDNALLTVAYLEAFQLTGDPLYARVAREVLAYVEREMTSPEGAFYSATDADSPTPSGEREEGRFFTWTPDELRAVLPDDELALVTAHYGVSAAGNFEGRSILHVARPLDEVARTLDITPERALEELAAARRRLRSARERRPGPLRDDKILTSWNGLMISAFAVGGFVLDDPGLLQRAERAAGFAWKRLRVEGRLKRAYRDGRAHPDGFLEDYAFMIAGLLDLYEAGADFGWLERAIELQRVLDRDYRDGESGGYFMTSDDHERLLAREKPSYDGAEPSGNSVEAMNLVRLHELTGDDRYRKEAERLFRGFGSALRRRPQGLSEMLLALDFQAASPRELVIVTAGETEQAKPFLDVLRESFVPNRVLAVVRQSDVARQADRLPMLRGKTAREARPTAYVCERGVCQLPTSDPAVFAEQLAGAGGGG